MPGCFAHGRSPEDQVLKGPPRATNKRRNNVKNSVHVPSLIAGVVLLAAPWTVGPANAQSGPHAGVPGTDPATASTPQPSHRLQTPGSLAAPQAFGPNYQWTSVFASHWVPADSNTNPPAALRYPYVCVNPNDLGGILSRYWTQLDLPNGAEVVSVYVAVMDDATGSKWELYFSSYEAGSRFSAPFYIDHESDSTLTDGTPGYTELQFAVDPLVVVREFQDLNGDGYFNLSATALVLIVSPLPATPNQMCFFGGGIQWRRTVSPAPATATFTDVPTGHWTFPFVEALAASGITAGCGGGYYCPDDPLTRGQMAVYLAAALGLHWPE